MPDYVPISREDHSRISQETLNLRVNGHDEDVRNPWLVKLQSCTEMVGWGAQQSQLDILIRWLNWCNATLCQSRNSIRRTNIFSAVVLPGMFNIVFRVFSLSCPTLGASCHTGSHICWFRMCQGMRETLLIIEHPSLLSQLYIRPRVETW